MEPFFIVLIKKYITDIPEEIFYLFIDSKINKL